MEAVLLPFVFDYAAPVGLLVPEDFSQDLREFERLHEFFRLNLPPVFGVGDVEGRSVISLSYFY